MTGEKNFSASFRLYNVEGLQVQFTVRADDAGEHLGNMTHYLAALLKAGWRISEPTGDLRPKFMRIVGFVRGQSEDKRLVKFMPCVHLFSAYGDYKQITVYHEQLGSLPIPWEDAKVFDSSAPDRETARKRGYWNDCDVTIILEPMVDQDGNPITTDKGNIRYKFAGVKGAEGMDFTLDDVDELDPDPTPQAAKAAPSSNGNGAAVGQKHDNPFDDPPLEEPAFKAQLGKIHALIGALYPKAEQDAARHRLVQWVTNGSKTSSKDLSAVEADRLIYVLEKRVRESGKRAAAA